MANIAPVLDLNLFLLKELEMGHSFKQTLIKYVSRKTKSTPMILDIVQILRHKESETDYVCDYFGKTIHRKWMLTLIHRGLMGEPVHPQLKILKTELVKMSFDEVEEDADRLPFVCLAPLFFLMVPSFLLILIFPLIWEFTNAR